MSCVFGKGYVFLYLIGFCVVKIKKWLFRGYVLLLIVVWFFVIVFKSVDWVWGVVWLILFVNKIVVKIGFGWNLNFFVCEL